MTTPRLGSATTAAISLGVVQLATGLLLRAVSTPNIDQQRVLSSPPVVVVSEAIKFAVAAFLYVRYDQSSLKSEKDVDYEHELEDGAAGKSHRLGSAEGIFKSLRQKLSLEAAYGLMLTAIAYMLASGVSHPISSSSESGFNGLIRASVVMTTALMMVYMLRSKFNGGQVAAVMLLMCGAAVLQFSTPSDITNSNIASFLLFSQTIVLAGASVYNQKVYQRSDGSFQLMMMTLFGYSTVLNAALVLASYIRSEPLLDTVVTGSATMIIAVICNVLVGLASAAVLKYDDALVMYFVLSLSTGCLLCFEQFFTASISLLAIPAAGVILLATYQYYLATPSSTSEPGSPLEAAHIQLTPPPMSRVSRYIKTPIGILLTTAIALALCIPLDRYQSSIHHTLPSIADISGEMSLLPELDVDVVTSPFQNTVAFIRINHDLPVREKLVRDAYGPFFHTVHVSMPSDDKITHKETDTSPERDYWNDGFLPYAPVKDLLNLLLEKEQAAEHSNDTDAAAVKAKGPIKGLLYFHFDAWIEPLQFRDMPMERLWILNSGESLPYKCMRGDPYREPTWMWFANGGVDTIKRANRVAAHVLPHLDIDVEEFCMGWSDLYFLPSRFFADFNSLATSYSSIPLMHEMALPTIWRILERSYSTHPSNSVVLKWGDCFGGCCKAVRFKDEILENRCGHKFNYLDWETTRVHYERLEKNAALLGKPWPTESVMAWENWV